MAMNPAFWRGKRVFLTGHTGFKGSWLSLWLQQLGAHVTGYALEAPSKPSLFDTAHVGAGMTSIIGDIRDGIALREAMMKARPEIVIHMAAQALVRYSYANPVETYATNVMGTGELARSGAPYARHQGRGQRHHRQVLRKQGMGLGLSRERSLRRLRPLQQQQGLRRAGDGRLPLVVLQSRKIR
jgi:hypothetical protein